MAVVHVNSSVSWRDTYYTRSLDSGDGKLRTPTSIDSTHVVGTDVRAIFTRVWNTPNNGYAERFKHTNRTVSACSGRPRSQHDRIVQNDGSDGVYGDTTAETPASATALRQAQVAAQSGAADRQRDITQTYYTDARALRSTPVCHQLHHHRAQQVLADRDGRRATPTQ